MLINWLCKSLNSMRASNSTETAQGHSDSVLTKSALPQRQCNLRVKHRSMKEPVHLTIAQHKDIMLLALMLCCATDA